MKENTIPKNRLCEWCGAVTIWRALHHEEHEYRYSWMCTVCGFVVELERRKV